MTQNITTFPGNHSQVSKQLKNTMTTNTCKAIMRISIGATLGALGGIAGGRINNSISADNNKREHLFSQLEKDIVTFGITDRLKENSHNDTVKQIDDVYQSTFAKLACCPFIILVSTISEASLVGLTVGLISSVSPAYSAILGGIAGGITQAINEAKKL